MSPTKAGTAQERSRRLQAWTVAQTRFTAGLGAGVSEAEARKVWNGLDWPEKAVAYWTAYDDPAMTLFTEHMTERTTDHTVERTVGTSASPVVGPASEVAGELSELGAGPAATGAGKAPAPAAAAVHQVSWGSRVSRVSTLRAVQNRWLGPPGSGWSN